MCVYLHSDISILFGMLVQRMKVVSVSVYYLPPELIGYHSNVVGRKQNKCFALVFWNEMHYRLVDVRINTPLNALHHVKMVKIGSVVFELKWGRKWKLCCDTAEIGRFSFIWHTGVLKRIIISQFWFQQVDRQSCLYILWKFGEIQIIHPGVLGEKNCTTGVDNCYHAYSSPMFAMGWGC